MHRVPCSVRLLRRAKNSNSRSKQQADLGIKLMISSLILCRSKLKACPVHIGASKTQHALISAGFVDKGRVGAAEFEVPDSPYTGTCKCEDTRARHSRNLVSSRTGRGRSQPLDVKIY